MFNLCFRWPNQMHRSAESIKRGWNIRGTMMITSWNKNNTKEHNAWLLKGNSAAKEKNEKRTDSGRPNAALRLSSRSGSIWSANGNSSSKGDAKSSLVDVIWVSNAWAAERSCQSVIASYFSWVVWKKMVHIRVHTLQETQQTVMCYSQKHC